MIIKSINFYNWRNFVNKEFNFNPFTTIIVGLNAQGKTNLLEGIYFLINTTGFREKKEEELIFFDKNKASVEGEFVTGDYKFDFQIILERKNDQVQKKYFINKSQKNSSLYLREQTKTVIFSPNQIKIIDNSPSERRDYFNKFLSTVDAEYKKAWHNYENALKKRNKLLQLITNENKLKEEILFWNQYLEKQAIYISKKREEYVIFLNKNCQLENKIFEINYLKNEFSQEKAKLIFNEELRLKQTLIGPQRDDFQIYLKNGNFKKNLHRFGSRSEQRMALFWLKLNEINFLENKFNKKPIVLLDDVFSELDFYNKQLISRLVKSYQTIITTAEIEVLNFIEAPKSIIKL